MGTEMQTESGEKSQYAKMLDILNSDVEISDYLDLRDVDAVDKYLRVLDVGEYGIDADTYIKYENILPTYDADGNGSYKQAEITAALNAMTGLDNTQRAVLWQCANKSWAAKNNPFSSSVSAQVRAALTEEKSNELTLPMAASFFASAYRAIFCSSVNGAPLCFSLFAFKKTPPFLLFAVLMS